MKRNLLTIAIAIAVMFLVPIATLAQQPKGAFSISNDTGATIHYQIRWGNEPWKDQTLRSGWVRRHWHTLDSQGRAPRPYVRFDRIGGDGKYTEQIQQVGFYNVWDRGPVPVIDIQWNITPPKAYYFEYSPNGREIYLKEK